MLHSNYVILTYFNYVSNIIHLFFLLHAAIISKYLNFSDESLTSHGYEIAPRFRDNPNVPGTARRRQQQSEPQAYEVFIRPFRRPGQVFYKLISANKRKLVIKELKKDEYIDTVPDEVVSSMESLASSRQSAQNLETVSTGTRSMRSLSSAGGDTSSLRSVGAESSMSSGSYLDLPTTVPEDDQELAQQDTMPPEVDPPFNLNPEGDIEGVFDMQNPQEYDVLAEPQNTDDAPLEASGGADAVFKRPQQQPSKHKYTTRSKSQGKRPAVVNRFRQNMLIEKDAREIEKKATDPFGLHIVQGREELERQEDRERQRR